MLDQRPIPRYLVGFPTEIQENIMRTVESQLAEMSDAGFSREEAEEVIEVQLNKLKPFCKGITDLSYQPNLMSYLAALSAAEDQQ